MPIPARRREPVNRRENALSFQRFGGGSLEGTSRCTSHRRDAGNRQPPDWTERGHTRRRTGSAACGRTQCPGSWPPAAWPRCGSGRAAGRLRTTRGGGSGSDIMADGRGSTLDSLLVHCTGGAPVVHSKAFMPHWCKSLYEVTYLFA